MFVDLSCLYLCMIDLEAAIHEVEKRLEYFAVAAQVEATMKMGFVSSSFL